MKDMEKGNIVGAKSVRLGKDGVLTRENALTEELAAGKDGGEGLWGTGWQKRRALAGKTQGVRRKRNLAN